MAEQCFVRMENQSGWFNFKQLKNIYFDNDIYHSVKPVLRSACLGKRGDPLFLQNLYIFVIFRKSVFRINVNSSNLNFKEKSKPYSS